MSLYMVEPRRIELLSEIFTYPKHFYAIDVVSVLPLQAGTCDTVKSFPGRTESVHLHHLVFFSQKHKEKLQFTGWFFYRRRLPISGWYAVLEILPSASGGNPFSH